MLFIIVYILALTSCKNEIDKIGGQALVEKARTDYEKLNSGKVVVTNVETNEIEQTLTFKYDEVGLLIYALESGNSQEAYCQYNNGYQAYTINNGEYTFYEKGNRNFEAYTKDVKYPQLSKTYLYFDVSKISDVEIEKPEKLSKYIYTYDNSKITGDKGLGSLESFVTSYVFDENDDMLYFEEISSYVKDGKSTEHHYKIELIDKNNVEKVQIPKDIQSKINDK